MYVFKLFCIVIPCKMLLMFLFKPPLLNKAANYGENSNNVKQYYNLKHLFSMYFNVTYS